MENKYLYSFEDRFNDLLNRDNTQEQDIERKSLFYIIAGYEDLYKKVNYIYDFQDHSIFPDCLENEKVDFSSTSQKLIKLGFNLYNGNPSYDILTTFSSLDDNNFNLAINAIKYRFNK